MDLDIATNLVTAFRTYAELTASCKGGYVPTLTTYPDDSREMVRAKERLSTQLKTDGYRVFTK